MTSPRLIERLRAGGVLRPQAVVEEARRAGLRLPLACALLEKESGGGRNVFGHDPTIFVGAGEVTRGKYAEYKRRRVASGNRLMQGVGPCQLTWFAFQDTADSEGGCWRPEINMRVGFRHLVALIKEHGEADGARRYNGSGPAAEAYSRDLLAKARIWEAKLAGHPAAATAGPRLVRRGDHGKLVERITLRLSLVRSRRTRRPYLDGARRRFDGETEAALKAFQREHRLDPDGVFGRQSARAMNRAVELERERRRREQFQPPPRPGRPRPDGPGVRPPKSLPVKGSDPSPRGEGRPARAGLSELVGAVRLRDAQTDRSWQQLAAYGNRRRRLLDKLRGRDEGVDLSDLATVLLRIEAKLEALVEIEQAEAAAAEAEPAAAPEAEATAPEPAAPAPEPVASAAVPAEAGAQQQAAPAPAAPSGPPPWRAVPPAMRERSAGGGQRSAGGAKRPSGGAKRSAVGVGAGHQWRGRAAAPIGGASPAAPREARRPLRRGAGAARGATRPGHRGAARGADRALCARREGARRAAPEGAAHPPARAPGAGPAHRSARPAAAAATAAPAATPGRPSGAGRDAAAEAAPAHARARSRPASAPTRCAGCRRA